MSKIEWTGVTWNPLLGCSKVSPGCKNCYAIQTAWIRMHNPNMAERYAGVVEKTAGGSLNWTGKVNQVQQVLEKPLRTKKPTMFFVNSMSDLFHENIPFEFIDKVFAVMALSPQHTFQVLTKRPARMVEYFKGRDEDMMQIRESAMIMACDYPHLFHVTERLKGEARNQIGPIHITSTILPHLKAAGWYFGKESKLEYEGAWPLKNVWMGVSVENQQTANERIPLLLQVPAAVRFLSCEPLLGPVNLTHIDADGAGHKEYCQINALTGRQTDMARPCHGVNKIDWCIVGGESGKDARPMHPEWVRSIRDQCTKAGTAFFFKQHGDHLCFSGVVPEKYAHIKNKHVIEGGWMAVRVGKKVAGRLLDGREWNEFPRQPTQEQPALAEDPDLYFTSPD